MINKKAVILFDSVKNIPKKELLFFDKLIIPDYAQKLKYAYDNQRLNLDILSDLEFLASENIIEDVPFRNVDERSFYRELSSAGLIFSERIFPSWVKGNLKETLNQISILENDAIGWSLDIAARGVSFDDDTEYKVNNMDFLIAMYVVSYMKQIGLEQYTPIVKQNNFKVPNNNGS